MEKIRIGIIGCGGNMGAAHAKGFERLKEDIRLSAACDVRLERAKAYAEHFKGQDVFVTADYREMLDYVDAVLVVLPHDLHYECGIFFARHGKHILMEKPLCNTEEECRRLIEVAEEEGVVLMCAYPVRHWTGVRMLKDIADSGKYGKIVNMSIWTEQLTMSPETEWGATARLGGGQFFSHGCHYVDLLMWFLGDPDYGVHIGSRIGTPWLLREGSSNAVIKFKNGSMGYHYGTWGACGSKMGYDFQIQFEKATVEYAHNEGYVRVYQNPDLVEKKEKWPVIDNSKGGSIMKYEEIWRRGDENTKETEKEIEHFADCIRNHKTPITDGRTSLRGLQVIWAMYEAEKARTMADLSHI